MESKDLDEDYPTITDGVRRPSYDQGKGSRKGSLNKPGQRKPSQGSDPAQRKPSYGEPVEGTFAGKPNLKHASPGKNRKEIAPSVSSWLRNFLG